ncbi:MAG TPA: FMN-binding glutamate synthase family protein [Dehalococcoidia bacterium]|nr:FMN-binding glutamate synthase family protein [Dehalococcoidia bacterium]
MVMSRINASAATLTKNRTEDSVSPSSGMCVTCIDGCVGMCEVGKSAYRGAEVIYPQPYGIITTASEKNYPLDLSHFTILGTVVGAKGIEENSDKAIFANVDLERKIGIDGNIKIKLPIVIGGLGSTAIAKNNWEGLAIGAAITGIPLTIGENVCGMDPDAKIVNGEVVRSPELEHRVKIYKEWQQNGYGIIIVQNNIEDTKLNVDKYAISQLGVEAIELKWGQGAKDIGGEVMIGNLDRARMLKDRGYVLIPDPASPTVDEAFKQGKFKEFERHSRVGMITEEGFIARVEELRKRGAKYISLKTGAYRPADLARALKFCSKAKVDFLTIDGAGGGTGMSPWRMMNEWGIPAVYLWSLAFRFAEKLAAEGEHIPDIGLASGFAFEDQIFKGLSLGAPYVKFIAMARAPLAAAMVGKTIGKRMAEKQVPVYIERFGTTPEEVFVTASELKQRFGNDFARIPTGALGLYTYMQRLDEGLRQLMAGSRKFALEYISRDDIAALTVEAAKVSDIPYVMEVDKEEVDKILDT